MDDGLSGRYISRGSVTIAGRDFRSGETFEASEAQVAEALACGMAEAWPPAEGFEVADAGGTLLASRELRRQAEQAPAEMSVAEVVEEIAGVEPASIPTARKRSR
jgi:hypothetical protein